MSFGKNLQYLRRLSFFMTQEALAEKLDVSRQTISKWEMDMAQPEMNKAIELCRIFSCTLDNLFRDDLACAGEMYSNLRVETVDEFRYVKYAVISVDPEGDAIGHMRNVAKECKVDNPKIIGWDFPRASQEQINVFHMHGYEAAWILPEGVSPKNMKVYLQSAHKYAAIHIENPFDDPFNTIPGAYRTLMDYMRINNLKHADSDVIECFETDGASMDIYIACV
ncbi:MAG: helix-turn-helix domain-containing protein [Clostridia bacterium]|nr:helix-turn-helix domain-containing protein [Clostridia bacterium]